jgi:hypothetical protein
LKKFLINCEELIEVKQLIFVELFVFYYSQESEKQQTDEIFFLNEPINEKLKRILNEKHQQFKEILKLKSDLEEEKNRSKTFKAQIPDSIDLHNEIYDFEQQSKCSNNIFL